MPEFSRIYKTDLSDRQLMAFWQEMRSSGRDRLTLYPMPALDGPAFCTWARQPDVHLWIILFRGEPCGMFFLTDQQGKTAECHFGMLPPKRLRTERRLPVQQAFGLFCLANVLYERNVSGGYLLDRCIGVTPLCNRDAVRFIHRCGARDCGVVPGGCWFAETGENVDALITVYSREAIPEQAKNF